MSILSNIFRKIFPASHPAVVDADKTATIEPAAANPTPAATSAPQAATAPKLDVPEVDVENMLTVKAQSAGQTLNWRSSIVDLLKLLELDSSLEARKELAIELNYTGDSSDSAAMNIWLHRQVMNKLAANGGKVPADLKD